MNVEDRKRKNKIKAKLYLLAAGVLILGTLLFYEKSVAWQAAEKDGEAQKQQAGREPGTGDEGKVSQESTEEQKTAEKGAAEEERKETEETEETAQQEYNGMIRVLLKTDAYEKEVHETVEVSSASGQDLTVTDGETGTEIDSGNTLSFIREGDTLFVNDEPLAELPERLLVRTAEGDEAGIAVNTVQRNHGTPVYEGVLEIWPADEGFYLVNELPFETYLKYVVPSEMPASYAAEALKAQAVCARTYAFRQLQTCGYPACGAQVDDSVAYQVYNNTGAADSTSQAVEETAGLVLTYGGFPVTAYYFSTSCGATGTEEIWWEGNAALTPYLSAKTVNGEGKSVDLSGEEAFEEFLETEDPACFDADMSWYRWEAEADLETLTDNVNSALPGQYAANPEAILTKEGDSFVSREIESIGRIQGIEVLERNAGGAVVKLQIRGSLHTVQVMTEYNVRAILNLKGCTVVRNDGTAVAGTSLLPSAFVVIAPVFDEEGGLSAWHFEGGGYGHGTGLSQNGANAMAAQGMNFEEILKFYYSGTELTGITELG